jgi:uncharacterized membrane protein YfcA
VFCGVRGVGFPDGQSRPRAPRSASATSKIWQRFCSLSSLVAPGSVIALVAYAGAGQVDWRLGIPLAVGGVVAISAGVAFAHSLPERRLRFAFCGLLVLIAALLALAWVTATAVVYDAIRSVDREMRSR